MEFIAKQQGSSSTCAVLLGFNFKLRKPAMQQAVLAIGDRQVPVLLIRNPRARRYVLRLRPDGTARVSIPRGGSVAEARRFAESNQRWLDRQLAKLTARAAAKEWRIGTEIFSRGELVKIESMPSENHKLVRVGSEIICVREALDLRRPIERHLWRIADRELPPRVFEYAALHALRVNRVMVRNQRSRWGSCSRGGTVSLNWRLIQTPQFVCDYIIVHELMHLRQMNHSPRFWKEVEEACPQFKKAEAWLKKHSSLLR